MIHPISYFLTSYLTSHHTRSNCHQCQEGARLVYIGASPIIAPPQPALSPAAKKTRRPTINRSPAILKISQNPANPASDNPPFPRRKRDPPPNHQPFACNPENPPKSCKSSFRQSALSPAAKKTRRPDINRMPAIPKISQNPANPASDNIHPNTWMHPSSLSSLPFCLL